MVQWRSKSNHAKLGTAVYTASWATPRVSPVPKYSKGTVQRTTYSMKSCATFSYSGNINAPWFCTYPGWCTVITPYAILGIPSVPQGDAHTQQHFHYMGTTGELRVDQAHRGFCQATDAGGYAALNVLYMR